MQQDYKKKYFQKNNEMRKIALFTSMGGAPTLPFIWYFNLKRNLTPAIPAS